MRKMFRGQQTPRATLRAIAQSMVCLSILLCGLGTAARCQDQGHTPSEPAGSPASQSGATQLSAKWEELTGPDFIKAIHQAQGVCLLPFGIIEKHGTQLPLGTDLINVRYAALHAVQQEYAVVFPPYYFGQIAEARHQPGTVSYPAHLQMELLQATTDEMARNGCKKIVIVNGHGGNEDFLPYFAQSQLDTSHDYVVYIYWWEPHEAGRPAEKDKVDSHAGESETSHMMAADPGLVHMDRVGQESGADQDRLHLPQGVYTGIWWYAKVPQPLRGLCAICQLEAGADGYEGLGQRYRRSYPRRTG